MKDNIRTWNESFVFDVSILRGIGVKSTIDRYEEANIFVMDYVYKEIFSECCEYLGIA